MSTKTITALIVIATLIILGAGCIENEEKCDEPYVFVAQTPRIPAATPTPQLTPVEPVYSTIWSTGGITMVVYSYDDECIDYVSIPFSEEMPYTDYDWNEEISVQEFVDIAFLGVPYNGIDVGYDTTERPAIDKVISEGECTVYFDYVYVVMSWWCTGTRY